MKDPKEVVVEILEKGVLMSLGTVDSKGVWVSDVLYVHDGYTIYWKSFVNTRHSKAIEENPQVAAAITISDKAYQENVGIQFSGKAERVSGELPEMSEKHFKKRGESKQWDRVRKDESWYKLTPTKIEVIHEPEYGLTKQEVHVEE